MAYVGKVGMYYFMIVSKCSGGGSAEESYGHPLGLGGSVGNIYR